MTRPEAAPPRAPRWPRLRRWLAEKGWVHVVLLAGAGLFLFPFAWMVGTSLKTDEEIAADRFFPTIPRFTAASPYVLPPREVKRPDDASEARWRSAWPKLVDAARPAVDARPMASNRGWSPIADDQARPADGVEGAWRKAAAEILAARVAQRVPSEAWKTDDAAVDAFRKNIDDATADSALDDAVSRCELTGVQWIDNDNRIATLTTGAAVANAFTVDGPAELRALGDVARLVYRFDGADAKPIALTLPFAVPAGFTPEDLHKLVVSLRPDDSWHRVDAELDVGGVRWVSQRTSWLAMHRPMALVFQPPGFDDTTFRARTWVPLRRQGAGSAPAGRGVLRLAITPSSTPMAIWGKVCQNYQRAFWSVPFWTYVGNSLLLVALTMGGALFSSAWVAYAFARLNWPGRSIALMVLLATMMLPGQVTMIPSFLIWCGLGWYNTLNPLWVGAWFGNAFFIYLMVQQMKTIPKELEEAARIDGFNAVQTWWYVIVPQVKPTLAGIAIWSFMGAWNEFMGPLVFLRDQAKFPLSLGLYGMSIEGADWAMLMAGNLLMTLPVIAIFFMSQRYFIQGITMTGVKG